MNGTRDFSDFLLRPQEPVTDITQIGPSAPPEEHGIFHDIAAGAVEAFRSGVADLPRIFQRLADVYVAVAKEQGMDLPRSEAFKKVTEAIEPKDLTDTPTLARKFGNIVGGLAVAIPKYAPTMALGPAMPAAFGAIDAATAWGRGAEPKEILKQGISGAAMGGLLKGAAALPRWPRMGTLAGGAAGIEAVTEGKEAKPEDLVLTAATMAALGARGRLPYNLDAKMRKMGYSSDFIKKVPIKEARRIVRESIPPDVATASTTTAVPEEELTIRPPLTDEEILRKHVPEERIATLTPEEKKAFIDPYRWAESKEAENVAYNQILKATGWSDDEINAMTPQLKQAIVQSGHTPETLDFDPETGRAVITGEPPKAESSSIIAETEYSGPKIEEMAVTPEKEAAMQRFMVTPVTPETVQDTINDAIKDYADKKGVAVSELPQKDIAKIIKKTIPASVRKKLKEKETIQKAKAKAEEVAVPSGPHDLMLSDKDFEDLIKRTPVEGRRELYQVRLSNLMDKLKTQGKTPDEILANPAVKDLQDKIAKTPGGTEVATAKGKEMTYGEAVATLRQYKAETDPIKKQLLREQVEAFLEVPKTKSLTYNELVEALSKKKPEKIVVKKGKKAKAEVTPETIADLERKVDTTAAGIESLENLAAQAKKLGWKPEQTVLLEEKDLKTLVDEKLTPEDASITPTGRLVRIKAGDKAVAAALKTEPEEVAQATEGKSAFDKDATLEAAAAWAEMSPDTAKKLAPDVQQALIDNYLHQLDRKTAEAIKTGKTITKADEAVAQQFHEAVAGDPNLNPTITDLDRAAKAAELNAEKKKALYEAGKIDKADYDLAEQTKIDAFMALDKARRELAQKKARPLGKGKTENIATISDRGVEGMLVRRRVSADTDEFSLLTKEGRGPVPGESGIRPAGKATIDVSEDRAVIREITEPFNIERADDIKKQFIEKIRNYYATQGKVLRMPGTVTLRSGLIDVGAIKDLVKNKVASIYIALSRRQGANKSIPREEKNGVYKQIMEVEDLILSPDEIQGMVNESLGTAKSASTKRLIKGKTAHVSPLTWLGQAIADPNSDLNKVIIEAHLNDVRKSYWLNKEIRDANSRIKQIFAKIDAQPNAQELREQLGIDLYTYTRQYGPERHTPSTNPLIVEAKEKIIQYLKETADTHDLRARNLFINQYFPLIADVEPSYQSVRNIFRAAESREKLPDRYKIIDRKTNTTVDYLISEQEFNEVKQIAQERKSWKELNTYQKNRIRYSAFQWEGIYDEWAYAPPSVQEMTPRKAFNPHLQERRPGEPHMVYKFDAEQVLRQYKATMIEKESDKIFLDTVSPLLNKYPYSPGDVFSIRSWMDKIVKQNLRRATIGDVTSRAIIDNINDYTRRQVLSPTFAQEVSNRIMSGAVRGLFGPDTAIRNLTDSLKTIVQMRRLPSFEQAVNAMKFAIGRTEGLDPETLRMYNLLMGQESFTTSEAALKGRPQGLKERLQRAETKGGKALAFYDWLGDWTLSPMRITENFNRFLAFQMALEDAGKKGLSFREGVRLGLTAAGKVEPDLIIPDAYIKAFETVIKAQGGYSRTLRNPLTRGPLARISTMFWSYPANTVQFMVQGLIDSCRAHDTWGKVAYGSYIGFQVSIGWAAAKLGLDVASLFGMGLLPTKIFSLPWDMLKNGYQAAWGKSEADREKGSVDFLNELATLFTPAYRYGTKVKQTIQNIEDGYKRAGKKELVTMDMSPMIAILDLTGFPYSGKREIYELVEEMRDKKEAYQADKHAIALDAIHAMDKGDYNKVRQLLDKARKKDIVFPYSELMEYYRTHKQKTYLQSQLEQVPKHLRAPYQKAIEKLEERLLPERMTSGTAYRSMWSAEPQVEKEEEE
jgi:hypothetical protein